MPTLMCTHQVDLINEQDDATVAFFDFIQHSLEALLKLSPTLWWGNVQQVNERQQPGNNPF